MCYFLFYKLYGLKKTPPSGIQPYKKFCLTSTYLVLRLLPSPRYYEAGWTFLLYYNN